MKKIVLSFIFITVCSFIASAQITKGSILLGGGISFGGSKTESGGFEYKYKGFGISPSIGFAVKDNQVVGFNLSYNLSEGKNTDLQSPNNNEVTFYGAGIFYRKYLPLSKSFYLFGQAGAGYNQGNTKVEYPNYRQDQKNQGFNLALYPGITYAVNKKFHLEASLNNLINLNYSTAKITTTTNGGNPQKSNSKRFGFSTNLSSATPLSIGFRFVLGK